MFYFITQRVLQKPPRSQEVSKRSWNGIKLAPTSPDFSRHLSRAFRSASEESLNCSLKFYAKDQSIPPRLYFITLREREAEFTPISRSRSLQDGASRKLKSLDGCDCNGFLISHTKYFDFLLSTKLISRLQSSTIVDMTKISRTQQSLLSYYILLY